MERVYVADLESDGLLDTATTVWCGCFKNIKTQEMVKFTPDNISTMCKWMNENTDVLIFHNGIGYDMPLLKKLYGFTYKGILIDTLIMSRLLNPNRMLPFNCPNKKAGPHSVEAWGYRVGRGKPEHEDWSKFSPEMLHRCSEDVEIQLLIYNELLKEAKGKNWKAAFQMSFKLFEVLQKQEEYGWKVDRQHMDFCLHQLDHWISRIDRSLEKYLPLIVEVEETKEKGEYKYIKKPFLKSGEVSKAVQEWRERHSIKPDYVVVGPFTRITFRPVDLNSNKETKEFLIKSGWEPLEWNTNEDGEKTSPKLSKDDPFDGIVGGVGRLVAKRVQCRQRKSIIEGLIGIIRPDGRIASKVNTLAVTGRATHRGIVNIPKVGSFFGKQMRKIFICKDGWVLVGTDSDSCQLRMLGGRMGSKEYIEAICNGDKSKGTDLHSLTRKVGDLESRDIAKNVIYCLLFGGGDVKLGKTAKKPGQGADLRQRLYHGFDGLADLMDRLATEWKATAKRRYSAKWNKMEYYDGFITGLDGRPIQVPFEHQLLVYLLQSDEAIMMSAAYIKVNQMLEKAGYVWGKDYGIVCWYHDEFTIECRKEIAEDVARMSEEAIAWAGRYFKIPCPHVGDAKIGTNWYSIH